MCLQITCCLVFQEVLEAKTLQERLEKTLFLLKKELEMSRLQQDIGKQATRSRVSGSIRVGVTRQIGLELASGQAAAIHSQAGEHTIL